MMDVGPQPKLGLLLSLTVMNIVAIGICICAPSPKETKSPFDDKKAVRVRIKKRSEHSLEDDAGIKLKTIGAKMTKNEDELKSLARITPEENNLEGAVEQVYAEEDCPEEESEMYRVDATHHMRNTGIGQISTVADLGGTTNYIYAEEDCPKEESEIYRDIAKYNLEGTDVDQTTAEPDLEGSEHNYTEGDCLKEGSEIRQVIAKPPTVEDLELGVSNNLTLHEKNRSNINVITINKNFGNDSSKEGSETSLNDMCGHNAEMRYLPQDLGTSVTAALKKSYQLIDTFNTKVIPAVQNFNEQIAKTAHIERDMDSRVLGAINTSICPAVIRMSDSINRINEKINRVTENIHRPKECSVSCQVSESLLIKSVCQKNSFFITASPLIESRILNLFGHISCRTISRRKDRPYFKKSISQYWASRKKTLTKKLNVRCKENRQHWRTTHTLARKASTVVESCSTVSDVNQQMTYLDKASCKENAKKETKPNESFEYVDFCNDVVSGAAIEENSAEGKINRWVVNNPQGPNDGSVTASASHLSGGETAPSLPIHLPSYLSSYDEVGTCRSSGNVEETLPKFQDRQFDNDANQGSSGFVKVGSEERILLDAETGAQNTSFEVASEFVNEEEGGKGLATKHYNLVEECDIKSLELFSRVRNTVQRMHGPLNNHQGLQDILDMLDSNAERNTIENLFLLILKIFDTWSESQLSVVPSRAISRFSSRSESTCISLPMGHKSVDPVEEIIESENEMCDPTNFYSCINTAVSYDENNVNDESGMCQAEEETAKKVVKSVFEKSLSRTPECTEIEESWVCALQDTSSAAITYNLDREPKALLYKEQYGIARKIAAECIEKALSTSVMDNDHINPSDTGKIANTMQKNSRVALRASSEESFYSWTPDGSSEDYSYYECDTSLGSLELSEKSLKRGNSNKHNLSERNLIREQERCMARCQEEKVRRSEAHCSTAFYVSRPSGSAVALKASSIESWMLNSTSGDGVEIRNSHSELKSEEMSDLSSRPVSFTTDMSDVESNHSFVSETSKDFQIRSKRSSRLFSKLPKKRPKTPKTTVTAEAPSHAQSDCCLKVAESCINLNASLSDEN